VKAQDTSRQTIKPNQKVTGLFLSQAASVLTASLLVTAVVGGIRQSQGLQWLGLLAYDQIIRLMPPKTPDPRLLVVSIDEKDLQQQQKWPISDQVIAQLLEKLQAQRPKVIGLDIYRDLPHPPGSEALRQQLQAENVIVIAKGGNDQDSEVPPPPSVPGDRVGFSDLLVDQDNITRRNLLYVQVGENSKPIFSFALRLALKYLNHLPFQVTESALRIGDTQFPRLTADSGSYQLKDSGALGWQILIKYHSPRSVARIVTLREVLAGQVEADWIKDKVILIGYTAPSVKDVFATPYSAQETQNYLMPGVVIHAQMVSQILSSVLEQQPQMRYSPQWLEWILLWCGCLLGGWITWSFHRPRYLLMVAVIALGGLWFIGFLSFTQSLWLPIVPIILGFIATATLISLQKGYYNLYHDSLTNLPNRRYFLKYLSQNSPREESKASQLIAVLFLDLDRFKMVNEGLSNQAGDSLLIHSAERLQLLLQDKMKLARVGGDEFAICVLRVENIKQVEYLVSQIQRQFQQAFTWDNQKIFTTVSIGIAYQRTGKNFKADELLRAAHIAMYRAKDLGKDRHETFVETMKMQVQARWQMEMELRKALEQKEFELYYQPIIALKTGKIAGFEALIRWTSSVRGFISPAEFIPIAEETGLIIPLGAWVLKEACQQITQWHQDFPTQPPLTISVNLSSRQFSDPDLVMQIQKILEEIQVQRHSLKLEITETMMMDNVEEAIALLQQLKELGLKFSIDDFGTGYSNLSHLHRFPVDTLKIDQSFVGQMYGHQDSDKHKQIVKTVVMLGHNLGLDVVAEGVETEEQRQGLKDLGCEYAQGYLFSKPFSKETITELMLKNPGW